MALKLDANIEYKSYAPNSQPECSNKVAGVEKVVSELSELVKEADTPQPDLEKSLYEQFVSATAEENRFCSKNFPQQAKHLSEMPIEVLMVILKWVVSDQLDMRSLENLASVSRLHVYSSNHTVRPP